MIRRAIPFDTGPIHFVGIGGIGMSGIAAVMKNLGYEVTGSDAKDGANIERLRAQGIHVTIGHKAEAAANAGVVVISSAIKHGNAEVDSARARGVPIVRRAEMLAEIMRLKWTVAIGGTHGKTTTTSMIAALLDAGDKDPTVINGGIINAYGANSRMGEGEWMVVEADESDGTFTRLRATAVVVTNMDPEHLDHYGSVEAMNAAYQTFVENIPFYGFAVMCLDHPQVQALAAQVRDRRIISYGFNPQADVCAVNVRPSRDGSTFDVVARRKGEGPGVTMHDLFLPVAGRHNVQNAVAAIAVARELGVTDAGIRNGLKKFAGVKRRFTTTGYWNEVRIVDDYAHHPVEIAAVLSAAREMTEGRVLAVVQPHRFTRLRDLFQDFSTCFNDADIVAVADVYAAGEAPIDGVCADTLAASLKSHGHRDARRLGSLDDLPGFVRAEAKPGDIVVCLGAGDITAYANALPAKLGAAAA
ncbi:UDP-N-acetylmuramate--L-alanine ligase [Candidatus Viadribacter manganicus]|uniref:UDP-N-acetylmuramate--L-alanine ligase n=1 Tax=Candidatus Viadribacter manganicus TaxID=1759059 RepID=A0A1B1AKV3_9PROT|nr:UDP-N-acetylmuramate--L-alanine ligase [Candidatus Viadribacter manganicus]ANP47208.1 UDP-N-acetylmuramate--alanine ligase [Candidatus Viadribacter manganicus]